MRTESHSLTIFLYPPPLPLSFNSIYYYVCARTSPIIITVTIEISRRSADYNNKDNKLLYYLQCSVHRVVDVIQVPQRPAAQYLYIYLPIRILWLSDSGRAGALPRPQRALPFSHRLSRNLGQFQSLPRLACVSKLHIRLVIYTHKYNTRFFFTMFTLHSFLTIFDFRGPHRHIITILNGLPTYGLRYTHISKQYYTHIVYVSSRFMIIYTYLICLRKND